MASQSETINWESEHPRFEEVAYTVGQSGKPKGLSRGGIGPKSKMLSLISGLRTSRDEAFARFERQLLRSLPTQRLGCQVARTSRQGLTADVPRCAPIERLSRPLRAMRSDPHEP